MPVQWVNRPHLDFRGFCGTIASGTIRPGDEVVRRDLRQEHRTSSASSRPMAILIVASAGDAVSLTLADALDVGRGDILAAPQARPEVADQFAANLIWMSDEELLPGRSYLMKIGIRAIPVTVTGSKYRLDVTTLAQHPAKSLPP